MVDLNVEKYKCPFCDRWHVKGSPEFIAHFPTEKEQEILLNRKVKKEDKKDVKAMGKEHGKRVLENIERNVANTPEGRKLLASRIKDLMKKSFRDPNVRFTQRDERSEKDEAEDRERRARAAAALTGRNAWPQPKKEEKKG